MTILTTGPEPINTVTLSKVTAGDYQVLRTSTIGRVWQSTRGWWYVRTGEIPTGPYPTRAQALTSMLEQQ